MIKTLLLDAGGVLVFPNWDRVSEIFKAHGVEVAAAALRAAEPRAKFTVDTTYGASATDADRGSRYFHLTFDAAGVPDDGARQPVIDDLKAYHHAHNLWEHVPDGVMPALERLRAAGVTLAVASNANGVLHRVFERVGLAPYFRTICDSFVEGVEKPDPRFFHIVLERVGGRPETAMHVGDLFNVDVVGARSAGLQPMLLDPHGLYRDFDAPRVASLDELASRLEALEP